MVNRFVSQDYCQMTRVAYGSTATEELDRVDKEASDFLTQDSERRKKEN